VADNIRFGRPEATRAEIEAAVRAVGAEPVISAMPQGLDTEVGERGVKLSAGERQLVSFARAWLADPALLILDEATSNLDVVTEARLQQALRRLRQGRTTILIAHRLSTVVDADQVAIVEDGRVGRSAHPTTSSPTAAASPSSTAAGSPAPPEWPLGYQSRNSLL
jgi:ATP-binding cassette, subfamily B, bacterial